MKRSAVVSRLGSGLLVWMLLSGIVQGQGPASLVQQSREGVAYASGGVGEEEREELRALFPAFGLHLRFAEKGSGFYLTGVSVLIRAVKGPVAMSADEVGPTLLVKLPSGAYRVKAMYEGLVKESVVTVPPRGWVEQVLYW